MSCKGVERFGKVVDPHAQAPEPTEKMFSRNGHERRARSVKNGAKASWKIGCSTVDDIIEKMVKPTSSLTYLLISTGCVVKV